MTMEQLECFLAAVTHKTFFDAAETLHISQPTLSKQIQKLENELNIKLFNRSQRSATTTEAGKSFYHDAEILIEQYRKALANLNKYREVSSNSLCIGTLPILTQYQFTSMFQDFSLSHPNISLQLDEVEEHNLLAGLENSKYDLIIARQHMLSSKDYCMHVIAQDELVVVFPADHPYASQAEVTLEELSNESFILMNRYTSVFQICLDEFNKHNLSLTLIRNARVESIISAVAVGEGISLLPRNNFRIFHHDNITIRPLKPLVELPVVIAKKKKNHVSPPLNILINFLLSYTQM